MDSYLTSLLFLIHNKHERDFVLQVRCRDLNKSCDKISTLRGVKAVTNISWDKIATKKIWQSLCNLQDLVYFETSDITKISWYSACKRQMPQKPHGCKEYSQYMFDKLIKSWHFWTMVGSILFVLTFSKSAGYFENLGYSLRIFFLYLISWYFISWYFIFLYFIFYILFFYILFFYILSFYISSFIFYFFIILYFIFYILFFYILFFISYVFI